MSSAGKWRVAWANINGTLNTARSINALCGSFEVVKRRSPTSQRPLPASLWLNITRREQIGPTWWAGTWPLRADRVKMRRAGPRCMTTRINDKRPVSSIIRQFTQNTVKVCFTLKQWHYFSGKMIFREMSFQESDCPGNVLSGKRLSGKMTIRETSLRETSFWETSFRESNFPGNVRKPWWLDQYGSQAVAHTSACMCKSERQTFRYTIIQ